MSPPIAIDFLLNSIKNSNLKNKAVKSNSTKFPCGICSYEVKHNDKAILCSECQLWIHINCNDISADDYKDLIQRNNLNPNLIHAAIPGNTNYRYCLELTLLRTAIEVNMLKHYGRGPDDKWFLRVYQAYI